MSRITSRSLKNERQTRLFARRRGEPLCWALLARIEVSEEGVVWSGFFHNHRRWQYDSLGPFRFAKQQYLDALRPVPLAELPTPTKAER